MMHKLIEAVDNFISRNHVNWDVDDEDYKLYYEMVKALSETLDPPATGNVSPTIEMALELRRDASKS